MHPEKRPDAAPWPDVRLGHSLELALRVHAVDLATLRARPVFGCVAHLLLPRLGSNHKNEHLAWGSNASWLRLG